MNIKTTGKELDLFTNQNIEGNRIANSSIKSYNSKATAASREKYWTIIIDHLTRNPSQTSRQIAQGLNIERTTLTGIIRRMQDLKVIYISAIVTCDHSNREVRGYSIVTDSTRATAAKQLQEQQDKKAERERQRRLRYVDGPDKTGLIRAIS